MRKGIILTVVALMGLVTYVASPIVSAETLRMGSSVSRDSTSIRGRFQVSLEKSPLSEYRPDEILIKLQNKERFQRIPIRLNQTVEEALVEFENKEGVVYVEPNYIAHTMLTPTDSLYSYQWNLDNPVYGGIHAESAWNSSNGSGATVAIIDTGVAYEDYNSIYFKAPDLAGTKFVPGYDFVNNDTHPNDDQGHGTHVAGTIAQTTNNGIGTAGLAYGASIMPIKVLSNSGSGSYGDIADGIYFAADHGADVISMSLGGSSGSNVLKDAIAYAYSKGVTIVAASGNNGSNQISYPAAYDDYVIAVGATRFDEALAPYSNYGVSQDVVAPGGDTTVDQNGDGYGDGVLQQTFSPSCSGSWWRPSCTYGDFAYYFYEGTSMATPHVAALAAMLISNGNAVTPTDVRKAIEETADDLGSSGWDSTFGWGLINASKALTWTNGTYSPPEDPTPPTPEENTTTTPENIPPIADAGSDKANNLGETTTFNGEGSSDPDGSIVSYAWDFGDNTSATGATPAHTYTNAGTHTVTLTVTDNSGATDSDTAKVTVSEVSTPPPSGDIEVFYDSFEADQWNGLWTEDSQNDWRIRRQRATDSRHSAEVDGRTSNGTLTSIPVNLQGRTSAAISFDWLIEDRLDSGEYLAFDISTDGGNSWAEYARLRGNVSPEDIWHNEIFNLTNINNLRIRFRGTMSSSSEDANVDNVRITAS